MRPCTATVMLFSFVATAGCGGDQVHTTEVDRSYQNLRIISLAYIDATNEMDRPPSGVEDLVRYIKKRGGDPDLVLKSPDDGQAYVIHWGIDYREPNPPVVAYERTGKDGKRFVCQFRMILHMTEDEFKKARFPDGKTPL